MWNGYSEFVKSIQHNNYREYVYVYSDFITQKHALGY